MANAFYAAIPCKEYRERLKSRIYSRTVSTECCQLWLGQKDRSGYGRIQVLFRGRRVKLLVHRLAYFLHMNVILNPNWHVSHLCHTKACVLAEHLWYEPQSINNARKTCKLNGECIGHGHHRKCLL